MPKTQKIFYSNPKPKTQNFFGETFAGTFISSSQSITELDNHAQSNQIVVKSYSSHLKKSYILIDYVNNLFILYKI